MSLDNLRDKRHTQSCFSLKAAKRCRIIQNFLLVPTPTVTSYNEFTGRENTHAPTPTGCFLSTSGYYSPNGHRSAT